MIPETSAPCRGPPGSPGQSGGGLAINFTWKVGPPPGAPPGSTRPPICGISSAGPPCPSPGPMTLATAGPIPLASDNAAAVLPGPLSLPALLRPSHVQPPFLKIQPER